jgi:copper transport protein
MGFAAVMLMGGLIFVERMLATPTLIGPRGVLLARTGALSLAAVPFLQNLFLVGDIRSTNIFSALPHFFSTFDLTLGAMLITQTVIGLVVSYIMYNSSSQVISKTNQQFLIALFAMYLIALAFSGHSRTMAWPVVGIPTDIVHTGAAAIWLGGLAALAFLVIPNSSIATSVTTYRQFGYFARYAVIAIVVTGIIQTLRLHGDVVSLFTESHGRILLLKIAVVAGMLKIADINRKRLLRRLDPDAPATEKRISLLWRASVTEIATGGIVLAVTAALVTSSFN